MQFRGVFEAYESFFFDVLGVQENKNVGNHFCIMNAFFRTNDWDINCYSKIGGKASRWSFSPSLPIDWEKERKEIFRKCEIKFISNESL